MGRNQDSEEGKRGAERGESRNCSFMRRRGGHWITTLGPLQLLFTLCSLVRCDINQSLQEVLRMVEKPSRPKQ